MLAHWVTHNHRQRTASPMEYAPTRSSTTSTEANANTTVPESAGRPSGLLPPGPEDIGATALTRHDRVSPLIGAAAMVSGGEGEDAPVRARQLGRFSTVLIAIALAGGVAACATGGQSGDLASGAAGATASPSADAREAAATTSALAAYAGYLAAVREAEREANPRHPSLKKYLADPLLTRVGLAIRDAKEHGAMRTGTLISDPTVTAVSLDTVPATVSIQDCLDASGYQLVYLKNSSAVPGSASGRYIATATATQFANGKWLISAGTAHQDQPC
jgi:hypothetical protein